MISSLHPRSVNPPATTEDISCFETEFGLVLPSDLREFLINANGVWIPRVSIPSVKCPEVPGGGIGGNELYSLEEMRDARETYQGRVSAGMLVFGSDDFGNALCIAVSGEREGAVYFWDHEDDVAGALLSGMDADPARRHKNEYFVVSTLKEFLALYESPDR